MSPDLQNALWGIGVLIPFVWNFINGKDPDALGLSGMLIFGFALDKLCWALWTPPEAMQLYPVQDAMFGTMAFLAWSVKARRTEGWKLTLGLLFMTQVAISAPFWSTHSTGLPERLSVAIRNVTIGHAALNQLQYIRSNNVLFLLELVVASFPGVAHAIRRRYGKPHLHNVYLR